MMSSDSIDANIRDVVIDCLNDILDRGIDYIDNFLGPNLSNKSGDSENIGFNLEALLSTQPTSRLSNSFFSIKNSCQATSQLICNHNIINYSVTTNSILNDSNQSHTLTNTFQHLPRTISPSSSTLKSVETCFEKINTITNPIPSDHKSPKKPNCITPKQIFPLSDTDYSALVKPFEDVTGPSGKKSNVRQILDCITSENASDELLNLIINEGDLIFECRMCRALHRALPNFLAHKRYYCREMYKDHGQRMINTACETRINQANWANYVKNQYLSSHYVSKKKIFKNTINRDIHDQNAKINDDYHKSHQSEPAVSNTDMLNKHLIVKIARDDKSIALSKDNTYASLKSQENCCATNTKTNDIDLEIVHNNDAPSLPKNKRKTCPPRNILNHTNQLPTPEFTTSTVLHSAKSKPSIVAPLPNNELEFVTLPSFDLTLKGSIRCLECPGSNFNLDSALVDHMALSHFPPNVKIKCPLCPNYMHALSILVSHMMTFHRKENLSSVLEFVKNNDHGHLYIRPLPVKSRARKRKYSSMKSKHEKSSIAANIIIDSKSPRLPLKDAPLTKSSGNYKSELNIVWPCNDCPKTFKNQKILTKHRSICHRPKADNLEVNEKEDGNVDLMTKKSFNKSKITNMLSDPVFKRMSFNKIFDSNVDIGNEVYYDYLLMTCKVCDKQLHNQYTLFRHVSRHFGLFRFRCDLCKFGSYDKSDIYSHIMEQHENYSSFKRNPKKIVIDLRDMPIMEQNCFNSALDFNLSIKQEIEPSQDKRSISKTNILDYKNKTIPNNSSMKKKILKKCKITQVDKSSFNKKSNKNDVSKTSDLDPTPYTRAKLDSPVLVHPLLNSPSTKKISPNSLPTVKSQLAERSKRPIPTTSINRGKRDPSVELPYTKNKLVDKELKDSLGLTDLPSTSYITEEKIDGVGAARKKFENALAKATQNREVSENRAQTEPNYLNRNFFVPITTNSIITQSISRGSCESLESKVNCTSKIRHKYNESKCVNNS
ncbi:unnamed protein product [Gordionus sp. m RMFG-2023]